MSLSGAQKSEIQALVASGQKIEAIKRFRELTGLGLKESMEAVTRMTEGRTAAPHQTHTPMTSVRSVADQNPKARQQAEAAVLAALRQGNASVIEAIKQYQRLTNVGLKEAKDAVDALTVVHQSDGRINPKIANTLVGMMRAGKTQEAVTHLMTNVGYEEPDARAILKKLKAAGAGSSGCGCGRGCVSMVFVLGLIAVALFAVVQVGCERVVRQSSLYKCVEPKILTNPTVKARLGEGVTMSSWMLTQSWNSEGSNTAFRTFGQATGSLGEAGIWIEAQQRGSDANATLSLALPEGPTRVFSGAFRCEP